VGRTTTAKKYVGIDCHDATLVVEAIDEGHKVELKATVPTRADAIRNVLDSLRSPLEIAFEEGILSQWLYETLQLTGHRIVVCDPRKNRRDGSKNDRIDSHKLAVKLSRGELSAVYHETGNIEELKQLAGAYLGLVDDTVRVMQRTKSVYRSRAISCRGSTVFDKNRRKDYLAQLKPKARFRAELLHDELDLIRPLRQKAKTALVEEARRHPGYKILTSVWLIGPIRAAVLLATLITPWRFRTKRQLWGYAGLAVVTVSSANEKVVDGRLVRNPRPPMTRGLNPNHSHRVKEIFKAIAHDGSIRDGVWKTFYEARLAEGMRKEMAQLALARKIAAVVLSIWKKGALFDPELISPTT
jgi:transposase